MVMPSSAASAAALEPVPHSATDTVPTLAVVGVKMSVNALLQSFFISTSLARVAVYLLPLARVTMNLLSLLIVCGSIITVTEDSFLPLSKVVLRVHTMVVVVCGVLMIFPFVASYTSCSLFLIVGVVIVAPLRETVDGKS